MQTRDELLTILKLPATATHQQVKEAYYNLLRHVHPDSRKRSNDSSANDFDPIALGTLTDLYKKWKDKKHDQRRSIGKIVSLVIIDENKGEIYSAKVDSGQYNEDTAAVYIKDIINAALDIGLLPYSGPVTKVMITNFDFKVTSMKLHELNKNHTAKFMVSHQNNYTYCNSGANITLNDLSDEDIIVRVKYQLSTVHMFSCVAEFITACQNDILPELYISRGGLDKNWWKLKSRTEKYIAAELYVDMTDLPKLTLRQLAEFFKKQPGVTMELAPNIYESNLELFRDISLQELSTMLSNDELNLFMRLQGIKNYLPNKNPLKIHAIQQRLLPWTIDEQILGNLEKLDDLISDYDNINYIIEGYWAPRNNATVERSAQDAELVSKEGAVSKTTLQALRELVLKDKISSP